MANVTCVREREIQDFLDGTLAPEREAAFRDHLDVCPHCRESADTYLGMKALLLELTNPEQVEGAADDHLSDEFLSKLARGACDFTSIEAENLHLLRCPECRNRLREIERVVEEEIRAAADLEYHYPVIDYYREQAELAAGDLERREELDAQAHDSARSLISCRRFQVEIYCQGNNVYTAIFADDPEMIGPLTVRIADDESKDAIGTDEGRLHHDRRTYCLGDIRYLSGRAAEISFEFEEERWRRRIRFGPTEASV